MLLPIRPPHHLLMLLAFGITAGPAVARLSVSPNAAQSWSAQQATGAPNAKAGIDDPKAWATALADNGHEWIVAEIPTPIVLTEIHIVESFNPGAISRVVLLGDDGREDEIWTGQDTVRPPQGLLKIPVANKKARRVRVELDTKRVAGWNEIDAIGFVARRQTVQWATTAFASSAYGVTPSPFARYLGRTVTVVVPGKTRLTGRITAVTAETLTLEATGKRRVEYLVLREKVLYIEAAQ